MYSGETGTKETEIITIQYILLTRPTLDCPAPASKC